MVESKTLFYERDLLCLVLVIQTVYRVTPIRTVQRALRPQTVQRGTLAVAAETRILTYVPVRTVLVFPCQDAQRLSLVVKNTI